MRLTAFVVASALVIAACGGATTTETGGSSETSTPTSTTTEQPVDPATTPQLMAAAFESLIVENSTFGSGPPPFTEYLVQRNLDPTAGDVTAPSTGPGRALTEAEQAAITATIEVFGPVRWIEKPNDWRTDDLMPVVEGSVILGIGEPVIEGDTALVPMSLWCGGLCGTWFTYGAIQTGGTWTITGIDGPFSIS